jgi:putative ABC transport system permease protein
LFSQLQKSANFLQVVVWTIVAIFLIVVAAAIGISFSLSTRERTREYALLRILGFTRKRLQNLVLGESLLLSAVGTYVGLLFASVAFFTFRLWIGEQVGIPFVVPVAAEIGGVYAVVIALLHLVGPVAVYSVANRVSRIDAYAALRETEH